MPTPDDALESDSESDHEAEITEFLAQHMAREHGLQNGVAPEAGRAMQHTSLTLSPVTVQQPAPRRAFNLSEAVSAGLSGLEGSTRESGTTETEASSGYYGLNPRTPLAAQSQARHTFPSHTKPRSPRGAHAPCPLSVLSSYTMRNPRCAGADAAGTGQLQRDSYEQDERDSI